MSDVILKGEIHQSQADVEHEMSLLEDKDVILLEADKYKSNYTPRNFVFFLFIHALFFINFGEKSFKEPLLAKAEEKGMKIDYTRDEVTDILEDIPNIVSSLILLVGVISMAYAVWLFSNHPSLWTYFESLGWIFFAIFVPIVALRWIESFFISNNRDTKIGEKIAEHHNQEEDILAIVGDRHIDGVQEYLDEKEIKYKVHSSEESWLNYFGRRGWKILARPIGVCTLLLLIFSAVYILIGFLSDEFLFVSIR